MALISKERMFTLEKIKKITCLNIANVFLILTMILPFFFYKRAAPQFAFYSELTAVMCITIFSIFACLSIKSFIVFSHFALYLIIIAIYLIFDIYITPTIYHSLQWLYIGSLFLSSLVAIVITNLCYRNGYKKVLSVICYGLLIGAILQDIVLILQIMNRDWTNGWIFSIHPGQAYSGNIGQRNLLAHYLSWGILATAYLIYNKNLTRFVGWCLLIFQAVILGATNSKSLVLYMSLILAMTVVVKLWKTQIDNEVFKVLFITVLLILIFQVTTSPIIDIIQDNSVIHISSIQRLSDNTNTAARLNEWHKAWLIFLNNPLFGTGWGSYAYQGFVTSSNAMLDGAESGYSLASHTHNIVLNLLAETGIIGTTTILGGFCYTVKLLIVKEDWQPETLLVISMLVVTALHSLLEFPLWHVHFFLVFTILVSILISSVAVEQNQKFQINTFLFKFTITVVSLSIFITAFQMYFLYWKMEQYTYSYERNGQDRIETAQDILAVGNNQPLLKAYSDIKAIKYLAGMPPDEIPSDFKLPLQRFAYFLPQKVQGIYYLVTQCDNGGLWDSTNWNYYNQLNYYYMDTLPTHSIILSMSNKCNKVSEQIHQECENYFVQKGIKPICSVEESKRRTIK